MKHFRHLEDPRADRGRNHSLVSIITIAILAVLAGADGFVAIEAYGQAKQSWLETFLDLPKGIPSHDTFGRVLGMLEPKQLAQEKVDSKSNEITAVPHLLQLLNLKGAIVTLDAMGTQTEIAQQIKSGAGDDVLALKGNQGKLFQQVEGWFDQAIAGDWQGIEYSYHEKVESGHHRLETRQIWVVPVSQLPPLHRQSLWPGLTTLVMVRSVRQLWNKTTTEIRFFISSLAADAQKQAEVIRRHWSIENSLHWVLDVTFNEDASRIRLGYGAENLGLLRRLSVNLLKREPSKMSLKMKRYKAGMNNDFMVKILAASAVDREGR
ncbi:MAG: ISAs1 family transposase [Microcystis aeruginosa LG13-11]|nr:ISAs1 family transposase [Microcystis aeruginosa LG13-11]